VLPLALAALAASLNPLLSEAVFSITLWYRLRAGEYARLNPLLSEAVFSMSAIRRGRRWPTSRLNPLLSEAVFSILVRGVPRHRARAVLILF